MIQNHHFMCYSVIAGEIWDSSTFHNITFILSIKMDFLSLCHCVKQWMKGALALMILWVNWVLVIRVWYGFTKEKGHIEMALTTYWLNSSIYSYFTMEKTPCFASNNSAALWHRGLTRACCCKQRVSPSSIISQQIPAYYRLQKEKQAHNQVTFLRSNKYLLGLPWWPLAPMKWKPAFEKQNHGDSCTDSHNVNFLFHSVKKSQRWQNTHSYITNWHLPECIMPEIVTHDYTHITHSWKWLMT